MTKRKKILILGAGGFIGSHLTEALSHRDDYELCAVDISADKLGELPLVIDYRHLDITRQKSEISQLIKEHDLIINLIAIANPGMYIKDPLRTFQLDFMDNLFVVDECVRYGKQLMQFSTSEVYGKSPSIYDPSREYVFSEDNSDLILGAVSKHRWIYACSKQLLERVIYSYGQEKGLKYAIIRPFNYIGPRIDFLPSEGEGVPRVFSFFMDALLYDKPMYLVNGGDQKRCYTDIRDATVAHMLIITAMDKEWESKIINVGHIANEVSIKQLAHMMCRIWQEEYNGAWPDMEKITGDEFYGPGYDDSDRRLPESQKIHDLGWRPQYDVMDCLRHTMAYYVSRHNAQCLSST